MSRSRRAVVALVIFLLIGIRTFGRFTGGKSIIPYENTQYPTYLHGLGRASINQSELLQFPNYPIRLQVLETDFQPELSNQLSMTLKDKDIQLYSLKAFIHFISKMTMLAHFNPIYARLGCYFLLNYFFTVVYNVSSKKVLTAVPLPCTFSTIVLLIGVPLFLPIWLWKFPRHLFSVDKKSYSVIALCHGLGHITTSYSLSSGSVSFTHVVKSAEPLFTALLSYLVTKKQLSTTTYLTLIPIVVGVALASAKEFSFSWIGFLNAMASNFFFQSRMVLSKVLLSAEKDEKRLSAPNTFRVVTIISLFQSFVLMFLLEGSLLMSYLDQMSTNLIERDYVLKHLLIAGISFYCYNEIAFWILELVHPITNAVGNTIKRVVLVVVSIFIFNVPVSTVGMMGASIAVMGSLLYALSSEQSKKSHSTNVNSTDHTESDHHAKEVLNP